VLPYNKVHTLEVRSYKSEGPLREMELEDHSKVTMDATSTSYSIVWKGETIAKNDSTTCPVDAGRIAFYSRTGGRLTYPVPLHWTPAEITARSLTVDGREEFPLRIEEGQMIVEAAARVPVMVYATKHSIPVPEDVTAAHGAGTTL
jgi:hypothetical protein